MICDRCGSETGIYTTSMFNTEQICMPCKEREERHPQYELARVTESKEVERGNYNYPGIGLPDDLRVREV